MAAQKKNPNNIERYKLKMEIMGSTMVIGSVSDHTIHPYPTSCEKSSQIKSVREFGTVGFAPYRPIVPVTNIRKAAQKMSFYLKIIKQRKSCCKYSN
jgi:hypothetical protein